MKNILLLFAISSALFAFGQYPSWLTDEFKNKVFCGEFETSGTMIGGSKTWIKIPYELTVSENGVQLRINPGEKFGRDEWGETIKLKYNIVSEVKRTFVTAYELELTSANETADSPITPKYNLQKMVFNVLTYDGHELSRDEQREVAMYDDKRALWSSIDFRVSVPYYEANGRRVFIPTATVCKTLMTKTEQENLAKEQARQKEVQKQTTYELVQSNLKEKKVKEAKINFTTLKALLGYDLSDKKYADLELMILDQEKKNKQEIEAFLKDNKLDAAIDLFKITGDNPSIQELIKLAILQSYPNPTTELSSSELNDLLQSFNEKLSPSFQQNANQELSLLVKSDGVCEIRNVKGVLINSFKCGPQYIAEIDYREIKVNVDANYSLKISVDCGSAKVVRVNLGNSFSKERVKIETGGLQFFYTADKEGTLILYRQSDGTPYTSEDRLVIKIDEARVVEGLIGKKAKFVRACLIKVNGYDFTEINVESDVELTRFKKIK